MRIIRNFAFASVSLLALATPVFAQEAAEDDADADIVVTGTLIRGIAPGGSQSIAVSAEKIAAVGAVNTSDLIASVPQAGNFLGFVGVRGSSNFSLAVNRPSLRYLGNTSASGASTLLLMDGHRLPGMGITQSSADIDAIAAGAIERVEIVTDGGSSIYGSDAIGGVMNFITRKEFDGVEVKGSFGFADNIKQYNAGVTMGKTTDSVAAYISYDYGKHDSLYGADRDWSQSRDWVNNTLAARDCNVGTLVAAGVNYALPSMAAGLGNRCDNTELATIYPNETKHSVFASLVLNPNGPVTFSLKGYYVNRKNSSDAGPLVIAGGSTVRSTNPFAAPLLASLPGAPTSAQYMYNLSPAYGNNTNQQTNMESYGFTPSIKADIGGGWQLNALANIGFGNSDFIGQLINGAPINAAITAGTFNPFNLTAAGNAAALTAALDSFQFGRAKHDMINARVVLDGALFALPAGDVKVAVGAEYMHEKYAGNNSRSVTGAGIAALVDRTASRRVSSLFGELNVPVLGANDGPTLSLSASGRYDKYSDFGETFNPKLGVNFGPVDWLNLRGNWGKSFQAPGISDIALSGAPSFNILSLSTRPFGNPNVPAPATRQVFLAIGGTIAPLDPQKATTWSLGFDLKPTLIDGFSAGATYYSIDYKGVIGFPPIFDPVTFYRDFADKNVLFTAGDAAMQTYFNALVAEGATNGATTLANLPGGSFAGVYGILDSRTQNLARIKTTGVDFYTRYNQETGFGGLYLDVSGTYITAFKSQSNPTAALVDTRATGMTKLRLNTTLGANVGDLKAQVTWNHSGGFDLVPVASTLNQASVKAFNVFNLFFQYKVPGESMIAKDLAFSLNVDNVFDKDPPLFRGADSSLFGVRNGFTLGRMIRFGLAKKF